MNRVKTKREKIIESAIKLFAEKGFHETRTADLASEAGVGEGTIYHYFESKEILFLKAFEEKMQSFIKKFLNTLKNCRTTEEKIKKIIEFHFMELEANKSLFKIVFQDLPEKVDILMRPEYGETGTLYKTTKEIIREGKESGIFREDLDDELVIRAMFGMVREICRSRLIGNNLKPLSQVTMLTTNLCLKMLSK